MTEYEKSLNNQAYEREVQTNNLLTDKLKETEELLAKYKNTIEQLQQRNQLLENKAIQLLEAHSNKCIQFDNIVAQLETQKANNGK